MSKRIEPTDYHTPAATFRVETGRVVYRLSSVRGNPNAGPHVWARRVDTTTGKAGQRELIHTRKLLPGD